MKRIISNGKLQQTLLENMLIRSSNPFFASLGRRVRVASLRLSSTCSSEPEHVHQFKTNPRVLCMT